MAGVHHAGTVPSDDKTLWCPVAVTAPRVCSHAAPHSPRPIADPQPRAVPQVQRWAQQQGKRLQAQASRLAAEREDAAQLLEWMAAAEEALGLRDTEPLPQEAETLHELSAQHAVRACDTLRVCPCLPQPH